MIYFWTFFTNFCCLIFFVPAVNHFLWEALVYFSLLVIAVRSNSPRDAVCCAAQADCVSTMEAAVSSTSTETPKDPIRNYDPEDLSSSSSAVKRTHSPESIPSNGHENPSSSTEATMEAVTEAADSSADSQSKKPRKDNRDGYEAIKKDNPRFRVYIKSLGVIPPEEEDLFWETIREPLPTSFRVTGCRRDCEALKSVITNHFLASLPEEARQLCQQISWYPENLAWQINLNRRHIKRFEDFKKLREWLVNETASGNVSRQETVSMIPPVLLDVKPGMKVLDMCAAPGSKTAQIIDTLQGDVNVAEDELKTDQATAESSASDGLDAKLPNGLVVANDMELKRCHLLTHQTKRLQSPCVVIANHDASCMPNVCLGTGADETSTAIAYDRILCDVPCSGDGTIRKNLDLWRTWHPHHPLALHPVQYRILKRGLELLAVGGRLVYSTCSMNPVENEAVISRILNEARASVSLVDCSHRLPDLKRIGGLKSWKIMGANEEVYSSIEEVPSNLRMKIRAEFFPPPNVQTLNLDRCIRILPHYQNTGAFFIAVFEKSATLPWQRYGALSQVRVKSQRLFEDEPLVPFSTEDSAAWGVIKKFFRLREDFPTDQLFIRRNAQEKSRHIYLVSKMVRDVLLGNVDKLRIVTAGVRILTRTGVQESECAYRLAQEGLQVWMDYLDLRKIALQKEEILLMLQKDFIEFKALRPETKKEVDETPVGSVIVQYQKPGGLTFDLAAWRAQSTIRCYVAKEERGHFVRLLNMEE